MPADAERSPATRIAVVRTAARVLPVNDHGEVLLLQGFEPAHPDQLFWFSVGGGLEEGEQDREAAVRELAEETGIVAPPESLLGPLLSEIAEFRWGDYDVTQHQTWWAVRVDDAHISFDGLDDIERATTVGHRWWTAADLAVAGEEHASGLIELMRTAAERARQS